MSVSHYKAQLAAQTSWPIDRIKDHALKIGSGVTPDGGSASYLDAGIPLLRSQNIHFDGLRLDDVAYIAPDTHDDMSGTKVRARDTLLNITGASIGRCTFAPANLGEANVNQHVCIIRSYGRLDFKYLTYSLTAPWGQDQIFSAFTGASRQGLSARNLGDIHVPLPSLTEQKRIAAYLDASCAAIDRAVATKQQQLETLDALRKSIIQKAVTQGLNPDVEMKVVPMDGVGLVPKHWRVRQLRYCCQISYGITLQLEAGKTDGVPILTVQNLDIHGDWKFDQEFCIDEELVHEDDILRHGDLLFNWRNGSAKHVGKTAFFNLEGRYTHVSFLLRMRCGKALNPFYLKSYLGALRMAGFFEGAKDKVNKTFNSTELNRLSVLVPPIEEQEKIVEVVQAKWDEIEKVRKVIQSQIETLTAYRKSMIHECVTGQRRITDADVAHVYAHV